jgi:hypothetical protein
LLSLFYSLPIISHETCPLDKEGGPALCPRQGSVYLNVVTRYQKSKKDSVGTL